MITVAIVDQELTFADALAIRLDAEDDIKVVAVAKASSGPALGGCADIVLLDKDPLQSCENYRAIHMVIKDGIIIDRASLPLKPLITRTAEAPSDQVKSYRAHRHLGQSGYPSCRLCS